MSNNYFSFRRFTVFQQRCAMKVGTDGVLLGAWANGGRRVLDIGTGTGLVALMMAQRYEDACVTAIDIDNDAFQQAKENIQASPFADRITVIKGDICRWQEEMPYDAIVSNPPYFEQSLPSPDEQRTLARHTATLSYRDLMESSWRLLSDDGEFSVVIPADCKDRLEREAVLKGFFKVRECAIKTTPSKQPRRYLLAFRKHPACQLQAEEGVLEIAPKRRSEWYQQLTKDFYL